MSTLDADHFYVLVFVGASQTKVTYEVASALQEMGNRAEYIKISSNGTNALDFHIAFYIAKIAASKPDLYFHIISKDSGFDSLIQYLKSKKILASRVKSISEIPLVKISHSKSTSEKASAVMASRAQRGASKPRILKTLSSTINSLFQKSLYATQLLIAPVMSKRFNLNSLICGLMLAALETQAQTFISSGGVASGYDSIGTSDPIYDSILFRSPTSDPFNEINIRLGDNLSFLDPQYNYYFSVWENVKFEGRETTTGAGDRTDANLIGIDPFATKDFSGGFVRTLELSNLILEDTDLDTGTIRLRFLGSDNNLALNNSSILISGDSPGISSLAPMTINATGGANKISGLQSSYTPTSLDINISNGASLEFFDSGALSTSVPSERLYFRSPVTGDINGGTLRFNLSNVYFNTSSDFKFRNNATLSLVGVETSAEFERLDFIDSQITLDRNTTFQVNNQLSLNDSDVTIDNGARLESNGFIDTFGVVGVTGSGLGARITSAGLRVGDVTQTSQLSINNVPQTNIEYLYFTGAGSTLELFDEFNLTEQLYAKGNSDVQLRSGALFNLSGVINAESSEINITVDNGATFTVKRGGEFTHTANTAILNNGAFDIDGDFFANQAVMTGTGEINILDFGRLFLSSAQSTLTVDNPLTMGSFFNTLPGGELHTVINVDNGTPENGTIFYGSGDINATRAKSLNVTQAGTNTASEMDGKAFTVIQAQNAGVIGTLEGAASMTIVEGGNIPALIDFTIIDLNTNGKPDLTLSAAKLPVKSLATHPNRKTKNHLSAAQVLINAANSGNASIIASLDTLANAQLASHFDSIHAEPYSSYMTVSLEHSDSVMNTVMSHAAPNVGFSTGATQEVKEQQTGKRSWMDVSYVDGKVDGSDDLGDFDYKLSSLTIGQDLMRSGDRALGAYFSFGTQKMDEHDSANQDFSSDTYHLGLYLNQANIGAWDLRGVLGYALSNHESKRQVNLSSSSTIAEADFNSHSAYIGVKGTITGYENDWVTLSPELGLSYIYYSQESIKESGDPNLSLNIDSADTHAIVASAGLNARFVSLSDTMSIYPFAFSRYEHDFYANDNNEHEIDAALVAHPDFKQSFVGQNRGEHAIISGIGLGSDLTSALQLSGGFDYSVSKHGSEWGAGFNLEYCW